MWLHESGGGALFVTEHFYFNKLELLKSLQSSIKNLL